MHTKQEKTHSPSPAKKTSETTQKNPSTAAASTRLPAWTKAWGDQPPPNLQTKLTVNQPGDPYEQEADRIANQVMRMPDPSPSVQRKCACSGVPGPSGECAECAAKRMSLQRRSVNQSASSSVAPPSVHQTLSGGGGRPLDSASRTFMEPRFGYDFSQVKVHTDTQAAESARAVNALAYTVGSDVVFGAGQYAPEMHAGQELLAHELAHVVQQQQASSGLLQRKMQVVNPTDALPGSPPRQNWEDIRDYITALCPSFSVNSSGDVAPSSIGPCPATPGSTACQCLCDLHNSKKIPLWNIEIDDTTWPHTNSSHTVTVHSTRSIFSSGAWGAGKAAGHRIYRDNATTLSHELCGHAWLKELGTHPVIPPGKSSHSSGLHDPTVIIENIITSERGISELRGLFADPHHGESFRRVTISGFPKNSSDVSTLPRDMQARLATVQRFVLHGMGSDPQKILVDVVGHADHTGDSTVNQEISLARARSVRIALGIPFARFRVVRGNSNTECPPAPIDNPDCRKVDIFMFIEEAGSENSP